MTHTLPRRHFLTLPSAALLPQTSHPVRIGIVGGQARDNHGHGNRPARQFGNFPSFFPAISTTYLPGPPKSLA